MIMRKSRNFWKKVKRATNDDLQEIQEEISHDASYTSTHNELQDLQACEDNVIGFSFNCDDDIRQVVQESSGVNVLHRIESLSENVTDSVTVSDSEDAREWGDGVCENQCPIPEDIHPFVEIEQSVLSSPPPSFESQIASWAIDSNITHKALNGLLRLLKENGHPDGHVDARTVLGTVRDKAPVLSMGKGKFIYFGLAEGLIKVLAAAKCNPSIVALLFNIDGQTPFPGTKNELWPILCIVDGICHKPIIIAAYYGRGKPKSSHQFLEMFVTELEELMQFGLKYNGLNIVVKVRSFICDMPALSFIRCTAYSNAFVGCSKCYVRGISVDKTRVFLGLDERLRTNANFRSQDQQEHHKGESELLRLSNVDMVKDFPVDPMHAIFINTVKRLCSRWKKGKKRYYQTEVLRNRRLVKVLRKMKRRGNKMTNACIDAVDKRIDLASKFMPSDFSRVLTAFSDSDSWKATQCRQFIMYQAPIVLRGLLDEELYSHMLLLHKACRIMSSSILLDLYSHDADSFVRQFVSLATNLLGIDFPSQAVYALIHILSDCLVHGTLDQFSAFPFESFQGELRNFMRSYARPLEQLWKRLSELEGVSGVPFVIVKSNTIQEAKRSKHNFGPSCGLTGDHYFSLKFKEMHMSLKHTDNTFILNDGSVIRVSNIIKNGTDWHVVGKLFAHSSDFYPGSSKVYVHKVWGLSQHDFAWPLEYVEGKAALIPYKHFFVSMKLLHL